MLPRPGAQRRGEFHTQAVAIIVIAVSGLHRIFCISGVVEFNRREWRSPMVLQVDESYLAEFVKQILNILAPDVRGQISDVHPAFVSSERHDVEGLPPMER
ncbi:hypothetical protein MRX96_055266 [Rhipicephalus microplus]